MMKKLRTFLLWLLLFATGLWVGKLYSNHRASVRAAESQVPHVKRRGTARIAPLSEAEGLLQGGGSPEALRQLESVPVPFSEPAETSDN